METQKMFPNPRAAASLLLAGQVLFIAVTQVHTGGHANDHDSIFSAYAASELWQVVHLGQFASMALVIAGLIGVLVAVGHEVPRAQWTSRVGAAAAVAALGLYGVLQAVDGVALKHAVAAWAAAPEADRAARFATAEAVRWLEWGARSYFDVTFGAALLILATALVKASTMKRALAYVVGASGLAYLAQGLLVAADGFSGAHSLAIVIGWVLSLTWMAWLVASTSSASRLTRADRELVGHRL